MRENRADSDRTKTTGRPPRISTTTRKAGVVATPMSTADIVQRAQSDPRQVSPLEVLHLQRTLGNRAVQRLLSEPVQRSESQPAAGAAGGTLAGPLQQEMSASQGGGRPLDSGVGARLSRSLGADVSGVRVHADARADRLSRALNADAFTLGPDMFFRRGKYRPGSAAGQKLIAHEAVHVVQQGSAKSNKTSPRRGGGVQTKLTVGAAGDRYEQEADQVAERVMAGEATPPAKWNRRAEGEPNTNIVRQYRAAAVQRKLAGAAALLANEPADAADETWSEIIAGLQNYEKYEQAFVTQSNRDDAPSEERATAWRKTLLDVLVPIQTNVRSWLRAHKVQAGQYYQDPGNPSYKRRTVLETVRTWLANEKLELVSGRFVTTQKPELAVTKAGAAAGNVNSVDKVNWGGGKAFFKADAPTEDKPEKGGKNPRTIVEQGAGIKPQSPRTSARAVAMYKIDQLLQTDVLVRTEFAISGKGGSAKFGQVMEKAKGQAGLDTAQTSDPSILEDPVLQRGLNKLQMLDALCGQVDRHMNNYYIERDKDGKVVGVKGIDNDLAFGRNIDLNDIGTNAYLMKYRGMPPVVDKQTAENLLKLTATVLSMALSGLLSKTDIGGAIARLEQMQAKLRVMQAQGLFVDNWGKEMAETASAGSNIEAIAAEQQTSFGSEVIADRTTSYMNQFAGKIKH